MFKSQVLLFADGLKKVVGYYEEDRFGNGKYCLYLKTLKANGKWEQRIHGVFSDFYRMEYIAMEIVRMQCMFESDR